MSYFISREALVLGNETRIPDPEASHIVRTRRHVVGDIIEIQDEEPRRFEAEITGTHGNFVSVRALRSIPLPAAPLRTVRLIQILPALDTADLIIQKATELGAESVTLVRGERTPVRLSKEALEKKMARWNTIGWEACKQSGRPTPPILTYKENIEAAILFLPKDTELFTANMDGGQLRGRLPHVRIPIGIVIGPEGGFSEKERQLLNQESSFISLGAYTLRAETAAIAAMSIALAE